MKRSVAREVSTDGAVDDLSLEKLPIVLSPLWLWRGQLGRIGSGQPIPGLAAAEARKNVDEIARKLGEDPDAYFFAVPPGQRC
jgi:hypothetical protein